MRTFSAQADLNPVCQMQSRRIPSVFRDACQTSAKRMQTCLMTLLSAGLGIPLCRLMPGGNSLLWVKWEKHIVFIAQAVSSVNCPPHRPKSSPSSAVLKYISARSALKCVSTSALLTVLMAMFLSLTQMAKNTPQDTPGARAQLKGTLHWTVGVCVCVCVCVCACMCSEVVFV